MSMEELIKGVPDWHVVANNNFNELFENLNLTEEVKKKIEDALEEIFSARGEDKDLGSRLDKIFSLLTEHMDDQLYTEEGIHGLRYFDNKLSYNLNDYWIEIKTGRAGSGVPPKDISAFGAKRADAQITLTWSDPSDLVLEGVIVSKWQGTKIVRKVGGYPTDVNDGVLVIDNQIRDKYKSIGFVDTNLTNGVTYCYQAFPYSDADVINTDPDLVNRVEGTPKAYVIYGVKIDTTNLNPESALTYTDMAVGFTSALGNNGDFKYGSWQDKFPFNQLKPCLLLNGVVNYYLDPTDYTKKLDGTPSDITSGTDGDVMIEFPKIYWKFETIGTDQYIRYSDDRVDNGFKCLAHMRGTNEKDKCYLSVYQGFTLGTKLKSLSGKSPSASQLIATFRAQANANGVGYDQEAYFQLEMLQVLFIVMFKSRNSQSALGRGFVDGNTASHLTGGTNTYGMFYGEATGKFQNKFCGIEDFWGNLSYWIDGFVTDASRNMLIGNQAFSNGATGYTNYGLITTNYVGFIDNVQGTTETGFIPKGNAGSATTYYTDYVSIIPSAIPYVGGHWASADQAGAFDLMVNTSVTVTAGLANVGARIMYL